MLHESLVIKSVIYWLRFGDSSSKYFKIHKYSTLHVIFISSLKYYIIYHVCIIYCICNIFTFPLHFLCGNYMCYQISLSSISYLICNLCKLSNTFQVYKVLNITFFPYINHFFLLCVLLILFGFVTTKLSTKTKVTV